MRRFVKFLTVLLLAASTACAFDPIRTYSVEFGHTGGSPDYCAPQAAPSGGTLFSVWTKIPVELEAPDAEGHVLGNMIVYTLRGDNWHILSLVGNIYAFPTGEARYNANFMLGIANSGSYIWADDYCTYQTPDYPRIPLETACDWVWVAWQVVVNADSMTFRQWLRNGTAGKVFKAGNYKIVNGQPIVLDPEGVQTVTFDEIRAFVTNAANYQTTEAPMTEDEAAYWVPSDAKTFQIGHDNSDSGDGGYPNSYLYHARMEARSDEPSLEELEAISTLNAPDANAYAFYDLDWKGGKPGLLDRTGNGRSLVVEEGGELYRGAEAPF